MVYKSYSHLMRAVKRRITKALETDVKEKIADVYHTHIVEDVYNYNPKAYIRRSNSGGLSDKENIIGTMLDGLTLEVKNIANPNESISQPQTRYEPKRATQFAEWIEYGQAYTGKAIHLFPDNVSDQEWTTPRPFTENTINDLKKNKQHLNALKNNLRKKFKVI